MTTTPQKGYTLPTIGADFGVWGNELNGDLGIIDNNLGGMNSKSVAGNTNVTATGTEMQNLIQKLTGTLTGSIFYLMPSVQGFWIISNTTSGAFNTTSGAFNTTSTTSSHSASPAVPIAYRAQPLASE